MFKIMGGLIKARIQNEDLFLLILLPPWTIMGEKVGRESLFKAFLFFTNQ
jgi:hypothetical protein